jgi:hypothetical protein
MIDMLDARVASRLPRSWFQRIANTIFEQHGISFVDEWIVRDARGNRLAELDVWWADLGRIDDVVADVVLALDRARRLHGRPA